eukprot:388454-Rhodomonas_salina.2
MRSTLAAARGDLGLRSAIIDPAARVRTWHRTLCAQTRGTFVAAAQQHGPADHLERGYRTPLLVCLVERRCLAPVARAGSSGSAGSARRSAQLSARRLSAFGFRLSSLEVRLWVERGEWDLWTVMAPVASPATSCRPTSTHTHTRQPSIVNPHSQYPQSYNPDPTS